MVYFAFYFLWAASWGFFSADRKAFFLMSYFWFFSINYYWWPAYWIPLY